MKAKAVKKPVAKKDVSKKHAGRPPKFATAQLLQAGIDDYFESCWVEKITENTDKDGNCTMSNVRYQNRPYTMSGLAYHLEMTRQTLCDYNQRDQFSDIIKRARLKVEMCVEESLVEGKNAAGPIFWLKNHAGYIDAQHQRITVDFSKLTDDELEAFAAGQSAT